jgi:hypothetical protein
MKNLIFEQKTDTSDAKNYSIRHLSEKEVVFLAFFCAFDG